MKKSALLFVFVLSTFAFAQRLPRVAIPEHYELKLNPDLKTGELIGEEQISLNILTRTRTLSLNAVGLRLNKMSITSGGKSFTGIGTFEPQAEMIEITFGEEIPEGPATLNISYKGKIRSDLKGLYFSKSERRKYAVTQFEGTYARMMFPSFDEPEYKATFDISVVAADGDTAISNGAIATDTPGPGPGKHTIKFATSPKMSTYLVALAVGDFKCAEGGVDGIPIRICAVPEKQKLTSFALHAAEKFMHFYNGYYSIKYPFKKLDMLAIPDYEWGGMENTASVFYKERALLIDAENASVEVKENVASVIAHEMAHQWFGDLVTMKWWNDVWLNEGFATWMTPKALEAWNPAKDQKPEVARAKAFVLQADARASTRPIRANGETPAEIKELFDGIAYAKGASVLHMMEAYLGEEAFRKGINAYLERYQNGNATSEEFWTELERASGRPVSRIMNSFINEAGAPVVSFECHESQCTFRQQRYHTVTTKQRSTTWSVPVCMRPLEQKNAGCEVMSKGRQTLHVPQSPFIANAGSTGYYRTAYTAAQLDAIRSKWAMVSAPERIGIYDDEWAMVRAGRAKVTDFLRLTAALRSESDANVLSVVLPRLADVRSLLPAQEEKQYNEWLLQQLPSGETFGESDAENDQQREFHALLFSARAEANDPSTLKTADELTGKFLRDPSSVDPTLASSALRATASHGNAELYDQIEAKWKAAPTPELSFRYLTLLAAFRDPQLIDRSLALLLSPQMREQDVPFFLSGLVRNPAARDKAWQALRDHWDELKGKIVSFGGSGPIATLGEYCSNEKAKEVRSFFDDHPLPGAERSIKGTLEQINECTALKKSQGPRLSKWLATAQ